MIKRLVKTIPLSNGELYGITGNRRICMAHCEPKAELYEQVMNVPIIGAKEYRIKEYHIGIIICPQPGTTCCLDMDFLQTITQFDLSADVLRTDGIYENILFNNLIPEEIDLDGDWVFEISKQGGILKQLMESRY